MVCVCVLCDQHKSKQKIHNILQNILALPRCQHTVHSMEITGLQIHTHITYSHEKTHPHAKNKTARIHQARSYLYTEMQSNSLEKYTQRHISSAVRMTRLHHHSTYTSSYRRTTRSKTYSPTKLTTTTSYPA
jgi:hypothetical protein